jgi:hypothetical protein
MKLLIGAALLAPNVARADEQARPQEVFLGELAWLQQRAELQLTATPAWQREHWDMAASVEYGVTSRLQLQLEGTWTDGPQMDVLQELELGAHVAALRSNRWAFAIGASATAQRGRSHTELGLEPLASLSFASRRVGANLSLSGTVADDIEPAIAVALFARAGAVIPVVEAGVMEGTAMARAGVAVQLGPAQLAAALGYGADLGPSLHAALTWEVELSDGEQGEAAP